MVYAAFGSILLGIGIALYLRKKRGRFLTIVFLLAGFSLAPLFGKVLTPLMAAIGGAVGGIAIGIVAATAALTWVFYEIKEKGTHKATPWVALVAASLLLSSGVPIYNSIGDMVGSAMESGNSAVMNSGK